MDISLQLTAEESIECLLSAIDHGRQAVEPAKNANLLCPFGNTGAGKSTLANVLHGCDMEAIPRSVLGFKGAGKIIRVKANSRYPAMMKIGHSNVSETFTPTVKPG